MSRWQLHLPHRSLDAPAHEVVGLARHLPEAERQTTRELAILLQLHHDCRTVGAS